MSKKLARELCAVLSNLKPGLVEKLSWEENLEYLTEEELKQIEVAVEKSKNYYGVNPGEFYSDA